MHNGNIPYSPESLGPPFHVYGLLFVCFVIAAFGIYCLIRFGIFRLVKKIYKYLFIILFLTSCTTTQNTSVSSYAINIGNGKAYFSPNGNIQKRISDILFTAEKTIDIAVYSFSSEELIYPIIERANNGVKVRIIFDDLQAAHKWSPDERLASVENIEVVVDSSKQLMHNKYVIVDSKYLITGSYNWSNNAEVKNYENIIIVNDRYLINEYKKNFNHIWSVINENNGG